jgi:hypothetical protein
MHAIGQKNNGSAQADVEDLAKAEGERIGTEWSLSSKWTSFVVVDNINLLEKTSRLYQAEKTELAELTRTRLGATNYPVPNQLAFHSPLFALSNIPADCVKHRKHSCSRPRCKPLKKSREKADLSNQLKVAENRRAETSVEGVGERPRISSSPGGFGYAGSQLSFSYRASHVSQHRDSGNWSPLSRDLEEADNFQTVSNVPRVPSTLSHNSPERIVYPETNQNDEDYGSYALSDSIPETAALEPAISELERQRITKYIALEELIYAQTTNGRFDLNNDLGTAVKNKFKHWRFDLLVSELGESMLYRDMDKVLQTARTIVLIEVKHADTQDSWKFVIQKARAFVSTVIQDEEQRKSLFGVLQNQLSADREMVLHALKTSRWLLSHRKLIDGILRSHILDDPKELLNILRTYVPLGYGHFAYEIEKLVKFLGDHVLNEVYHKERKENSMPGHSGIGLENPDEWTDGWDDILKLLEAIKSVRRERRVLES